MYIEIYNCHQGASPRKGWNGFQVVNQHGAGPQVHILLRIYITTGPLPVHLALDRLGLAQWLYIYIYIIYIYIYVYIFIKKNCYYADSAFTVTWWICMVGPYAVTGTPRKMLKSVIFGTLFLLKMSVVRFLELIAKIGIAKIGITKIGIAKIGIPIGMDH
jgi:hypothetical protein